MPQRSYSVRMRRIIVSGLPTITMPFSCSVSYESA